MLSRSVITNSPSLTDENTPVRAEYLDSNMVFRNAVRKIGARAIPEGLHLAASVVIHDVGIRDSLDSVRPAREKRLGSGVNRFEREVFPVLLKVLAE